MIQMVDQICVGRQLCRILHLTTLTDLEVIEAYHTKCDAPEKLIKRAN
jgi:hypothetical protein